MIDSQAHRRMYVKVVQLVRFKPYNLAGLAGRPYGATCWMRPKADGELLANLAVVVCHDVIGIRVDSDDLGDDHVYPGLFAYLSYDCLRYRFTSIVTAARERPEIVVSPVDEQNAPAFVLNEPNN